MVDRLSPNLQAFAPGGDLLGKVDPDPTPGVWLTSCTACPNRYRSASIDQGVQWLEYHDHSTGAFDASAPQSSATTVAEQPTQGGTQP